jgi:hypothetical protein
MLDGLLRRAFLLLTARCLWVVENAKEFEAARNG